MNKASGNGSSTFQPIADPLWGQPCLAYNLQILFDRQTLEALCKVQSAIAAVGGDALHQSPPHSLHVSVYALVPVREQFDKDRYWNAIAEQSMATLTRCCNQAHAFTLFFSHIAVSPSAIIAVATENKVVTDVRDLLRKAIPAPPKPVRHPDSIHCTLFRFQSAVPMPATVVDDIQTIPIRLPVFVTSMSLRREVRYPSLDSELVATFGLGGRRRHATS